MEGIAKLRFARGSARKFRRVIDLIKGKDLEEALNILHFSNKSASMPVEKTLRSALANLINDEGSKVDTENLCVSRAIVDEGPIAKRYRPAPMGRAMRIRKRYSHITIVIGEKE